MRHRLLIATAIISLVFSNSSIALEEAPGDACTAAEENFTIQVGGPETTGVLRFLRCNGTNWENYITLKDDQVSIGIGAATADSVGLVTIGQNAGRGITAPNTWGSVAIGYRALGGDSSSPANGNRNVAIGGDAMGRWSSGQNNTAVGADVAFYCLGGSDNTFVGARIGDSGCPSLSDNTVIGSSSAHMADSAIGNVLIGSGVGNAVDDQILSGNILIGYNIEPQTSPSASNELNIGNALFGDLTGAASNGAGTARIGINSNAPAATAALDVSGTNLGFLPPRNTDPNTNITSPAPGLIAYDITDNALQYFNGTTWVSLTGGLSAASPGQVCSVAGSFGTNDYQLLVCDGFQWAEFMKVENTGRSLVQIAQDTGACIPDKIGRLSYDGIDSWEYCDGSAWVPFERAGGGGAGIPTEAASLVPSDGVTNGFGKSVSVSGDVVLVGYDPTTAEHAAYLYTLQDNGSWPQSIKLTACMINLSACGNGNQGEFAASVSVSGDTAVIGAAEDGGVGASYIFQRGINGVWKGLTRLTASDVDYVNYSWDKFGAAVSIDGDTIAVGAKDNPEKGFSAGAGYVFTLQDDGSWLEQIKLLAADGAAYDEFGSSVALSGGTAVIGAPLDDDKGTSSGSAYVFSRQSAQSTGISYVGSAFAEGYGTSNLIVDFTNLTGGSASAPSEGDFAVVFYAIGSTNDFPPIGVATPGYTIEQNLFVNDSFDTNFLVAYKRLITTDTSVTLTGGDIAFNRKAAFVHIFRGVDSASPLDVPSTASTTPNTVRANPPAITPVTPGSWVVAGGGGVSVRTTERYGSPDLDGFVEFHNDISDSVIIGSGYIENVSGLTNPAQFTIVSADSIGFSSAAVTLALRPASSSTSWTQVAKLTASDGTSIDQFGSSVAIDGDVILVGAPFADNANGAGAGTAYVFSRQNNGTWTQVARLIEPNGAVSRRFGTHVAISGDTALIGPAGTPLSFFTRQKTGAWSEAGTVTPTITGAVRGVAIDGDAAAIGLQPVSSGAAVVFTDLPQ